MKQADHLNLTLALAHSKPSPNAWYPAPPHEWNRQISCESSWWFFYHDSVLGFALLFLMPTPWYQCSWRKKVEKAVLSGTPTYMHAFGCFLKWWYPQNTPKWSFLVGKTMVVGYHHLGNHHIGLLLCSFSVLRDWIFCFAHLLVLNIVRYVRWIPKTPFKTSKR